MRRVERNPRDQVGALVRGVAVKQVRRLSADRYVERQSAACGCDPGQIPSAENLRGDPVAQELTPGPKGQLIHGVHRHRVPDVDAGIAAVACTAALVLKGYRLTSADGGVGDAVRPHVIHLEQEAADIAPLDRCLEGIEVVIAIVRLQTERAEALQRALAGRRIDQINRVPGKQMMADAANISQLSYEISGQLLLDDEVPVLVGEIFSVAVYSLGAEELILRIEEGYQWIREVREVVCAQ